MGLQNDEFFWGFWYQSQYPKWNWYLDFTWDKQRNSGAIIPRVKLGFPKDSGLGFKYLCSFHIYTYWFEFHIGFTKENTGV